MAKCDTTMHAQPASPIAVAFARAKCKLPKCRSIKGLLHVPELLLDTWYLSGAGRWPPGDQNQADTDVLVEALSHGENSPEWQAYLVGLALKRVAR